jgi:hypothetical protein
MDKKLTTVLATSTTLERAREMARERGYVPLECWKEKSS